MRTVVGEEEAVEVEEKVDCTTDCVADQAGTFVGRSPASKSIA